MIQRISELKPALMELFGAGDDEVKDLGGSLSVGETCFIDWRETTGPITDRFLDSWITDLESRGESVLVLLAMGHFHPKAIRNFLAKPEARRRVVLVEMGLRNYFEERIEPKSMAQDRHKAITEVLAEAFARHDLPLTHRTCEHCESTVAVACFECTALICKSHMIICPICRKHYCHTDLEGRRCFHEHGCL